MVEYLKDLQIRKIRTKPEQALNGVYSLGNDIFEVLKKLMHENKVNGVYFTHYYDPPHSVEPHVAIGIRYEKLEDLEFASSTLDTLCSRQRNLVIDKGAFETTEGKYDKLPHEIVVDYIICHIICHSFEFLLKLKAESGNITIDPDSIANYLVQQVRAIGNEVLGARNIFRNQQNARALTTEESRWVWERFVHHLCNAYKCTGACEVRVWVNLSSRTAST